MSDIVLELTIEAKPESVFHAITLQEQITQWWANRVIIESKVGSLAETWKPYRSLACWYVWRSLENNV